jgi:FtsH-binding integral membrane protein
MSSSENPYQSSVWGTLASQAHADERADFIRKTYLHLCGAVLGYIALAAVLLNSPLAKPLFELMVGTQYSWLFVIALFIGVSYLANSWAMSATSVGKQYAGLTLYVVAQAIISLPLLLVAQNFGPPGVIMQAGVVTAVMVGGLTAIVMVTGHDFSYLRGILMIGGLAALVIIVWATFMRHDLGVPFSVAMIGLACGYILYDTSNVMKHYRIGQHVAAALALFASVILLFYYVLRLLMQLNRGR